MGFLLKLVPAQYHIPAKIIAAAVLLGVILVAAMSAYSWAYKNGVQAERVAWQQSENAKLQEAIAHINGLNKKIREAERSHAVELQTVSNNYQQGLKHEKQKLNDVVASYRAGTLSLRDKHATSNPAACVGFAADLSAGAVGRDATEGAKLSEPLAEFLIILANEADEVVQQLTACQALVNADRAALVQ
jgi:uncharacterized protein YdcH (DUF465 family)